MRSYPFIPSTCRIIAEDIHHVTFEDDEGKVYFALFRKGEGSDLLVLLTKEGLRFYKKFRIKVFNVFSLLIPFALFAIFLYYKELRYYRAWEYISFEWLCILSLPLILLSFFIHPYSIARDINKKHSRDYDYHVALTRAFVEGKNRRRAFVARIVLLFLRRPAKDVQRTRSRP